MFGRLMPHEGRFFGYFSEHAALIVQGAKELKEMMSHLGDFELRAHNIKTIEGKADHVTHQTMQLLHQTFITPLDREDIHLLITRWTTCSTSSRTSSHCMFLYEVRTVPHGGAAARRHLRGLRGEGAGGGQAARQHGQRRRAS